MTIDEMFEAALGESRSGRLDRAAALFGQVTAAQPGNAQAHYNLGNIFRRMGRDSDAAAAFERALAAQPRYPKAMNNLALIMRDRGDFKRAIAMLREAAAIEPEMVSAHHNLSIALWETSQFEAAIESARRTVALQPDYADGWANLGSALFSQGRLEEALVCHDRALALQPQDAGLHSNKLFTLLMDERSDAQSLLAACRDWNARHAAALAGSIRRHENDRSPDRRLRVGYVSPYFAENPVGWNIIPLLKNHDRNDVEVYCYSAVKRRDSMTQRLSGLADVWRDIAAMGDEQAAELIRADQIDVLVDLSLHTTDNRLLMFARKPAPVQVTYLSYCGTTGMDAMDYRLSDPYFDPPGSDVNCYSEKTVRLARTFWCYEPAAAMPAVGPLPAVSAGFVTFGCLNQLNKASPTARDLWAKVLLEVRGSRLLIHSQKGMHTESLRRQFEGAGVGWDRVELVPQQDWADYARTFNRIDVALDSWPYSGGITSCDTLYMGVPLVTLRGRTSVGRGGCSILGNLGLEELIADTPARFVEIARELAGDLSRLTELRAGLRESMERSALRDGKGFARDVETAYRMMWREWCAR